MKALIFFFLFPVIAGAADMDRYEFGVSPNDYFYKERGGKHDSVFDDYRKIELGVDLSSGVDCGRLDVKGTLKSSIDKVLDPSLFGSALDSIAGGAPLLTICYFSPTWCALAKHFRVNAQAMSQLRFDQCAVMDKYVDSRVEDYYSERQDCLHRELERTGGNHEEAVSRCGGSGLYNKDIANWAGEKYGGKVRTNKLIESSAKWAGFDSPGSRKAVDLVKAFVGETTISSGKISVEYGPRQVALSPAEHLAGIKKQTLDRLCGDLVGDLKHRKPFEVFGQVTNEKLKAITDSDTQYIDQQTVYSLMRLPADRRSLYCERLAGAIAQSKFSEDAGRSLQILTELSQNPNLPLNRRNELQDKRRAFKEAVDMTLDMQQEQSNPINQITAQINQEGRLAEEASTNRAIGIEGSEVNLGLLKGAYNDCGDRANCKRNERR